MRAALTLAASSPAMGPTAQWRGGGSFLRPLHPLPRDPAHAVRGFHPMPRGQEVALGAERPGASQAAASARRALRAGRRNAWEPTLQPQAWRDLGGRRRRGTKTPHRRPTLAALADKRMADPQHHMGFHLTQHPVLMHKLAALRSKETSPKVFRELMREVTFYLGYEATSHIKLKEIEVNVRRLRGAEPPPTPRVREGPREVGCSESPLSTPLRARARALSDAGRAHQGRPYRGTHRHRSHYARRPPDGALREALAVGLPPPRPAR